MSDLKCDVCGRNGLLTIQRPGPLGLPHRECADCADMENSERGGPILVVATIAVAVIVAFLTAAVVVEVGR